MVHILTEQTIVWSSINCDRACENRACGLKYTMSFDETYLNTEM